MDMVRERIQQWKLTAEIFLKGNVRAYIKDVSNNIYFCDILLVGEDTITIRCFDPEQRRGDKVVLYWPLIAKFEKHNDERSKKAT